ncbi:MAG: hydrogenase nickel incorporation protein HypB [Chloroflexi bacterium]|nr:hydrogenase nickel incorporation protein HypB [Chloroflexota bacterium]
MKTMRKVEVVTDILNANDQIAQENAATLKAHGILSVNLMASPGAGKTSLILQTARALNGRLRLGAIEGDVASRVDADKVAAAGIPVVQINTGGACHLDAPMIRQALRALPLDEIDLLIVENVGNLICPVEFRLGEALRVMIASVPEGHDKPYKYPGIFTAVEAVVINKMDLAPYVEFDLTALREAIRGMNRDAAIFEVSCRTGEGIGEWAEWLWGQWQARRAPSAR